MPTDWKTRPGLRRIQVTLPTRLVTTLDQETSPVKSRSALITEAVEEYLVNRGLPLPRPVQHN